VTIALALAACAVQNGHIAVDLVIDKFPVKVRNLIDSLTILTSFVFWVLAAVFMLEYANNIGYYWHPVSNYPDFLCAGFGSNCRGHFCPGGGFIVPTIGHG